jgi:hypothetical protein
MIAVLAKEIRQTLFSADNSLIGYRRFFYGNEASMAGWEYTHQNGTMWRHELDGGAFTFHHAKEEPICSPSEQLTV